MFVKVPATIMMSDCRGEARGITPKRSRSYLKLKGGPVPCCVGMHHLNSTAGQTKRHRPHRACACPVNNFVQFGYHNLCILERNLYLESSEAVVASLGSSKGQILKTHTLTACPPNPAIFKLLYYLTMGCESREIRKRIKRSAVGL